MIKVATNKRVPSVGKEDYLEVTEGLEFPAYPFILQTEDRTFVKQFFIYSPGQIALISADTVLEMDDTCSMDSTWVRDWLLRSIPPNKIGRTNTPLEVRTVTANPNRKSNILRYWLPNKRIYRSNGASFNGGDYNSVWGIRLSIPSEYSSSRWVGPAVKVVLSPFGENTFTFIHEDAVESITDYECASIYSDDDWDVMED